jgi:hypothetical protein
MWQEGASGLSATLLLAGLLASWSAQKTRNASRAFKCIFAVNLHLSNRKWARGSSAVGRNQPVTPGHAAEKLLSRSLKFQIDLAGWFDSKTCEMKYGTF